MGQNNSLPVAGRRRRSLRCSLRSPFPRRSRTHQGSLSATFNYVDADLRVDQLNVNTATEEELMTLSGITRTIAQNIVEYRQVIGRFNKVEDLALVSGVGADRLHIIRPEICVQKRKTASSCSSSRAQSLDSLASNEDSSKLSTTVDINSGSVFALMTVRGVNQELAANIVDYRERRGPYTNLEDLLKVRGMTPGLLGAIRSQLLIGPPHPDTPRPMARKISNGSALSRTFSLANSRFSGERKPPLNGYTHVKDIFDLLSVYSQRPLVDEMFNNARNGRAALRMASWNLHRMSTDKAENPGVREVICRTLLENRFSLVALQEIEDATSLEKICAELNNPKLRKVLEWRGRRGDWKCATTLSPLINQRRCGFIYDAHSGLNLEKIEIVFDDEALLAILAKFSVGSCIVSMLNVHLQKEDKVHDLCVKLLHRIKPDIILGDFTVLPDAEFVEEGFTRILLAPTITNSVIGNVTNFMDNIFLHKSTVSRYTGISGIVRQGLNHLAIPRGWSWGGPASEHCPVWCELYS